LPRLAANLSLMFNEVPFLDRFERAAAAGFTAVEFLFPYAWPAAQIRALLDRHGLQLVLHNLAPGDWDGGERGLAGLPGREAEFRASLAQGIEYARVLGVPRLHVMSGKLPAQLDADSRALARRTLVASMRLAAAEFAQAGLTLLVEPLNRHDMPGYFLSSSADGIALLDEVGADNALLQYDLYHMQRTEGEIANTITRLLPRIGHMQIADTPGRHEPGTGEMNYPFLLRHIDAAGYTGWIGCEYKPAGLTEDGLGWLDGVARSELAGVAR
jgi:hydroxypyruvate isomerase